MVAGLTERVQILPVDRYIHAIVDKNTCSIFVVLCHISEGQELSGLNISTKKLILSYDW